MDIAKRLKSARQELGYKLETVSQKSGIGVSSISDFENNKREPKFSVLCKLADVYKKSVDFFFNETPVAANIMLWRDKPELEGTVKEVEAEFKRLCEQYHNLEVYLNEKKHIRLPAPDVNNPEEFNYTQAEIFADKVGKEFSLGEIPGPSLKNVLEESYYVKIFYMDFEGSAISFMSEKYGPAILLNRMNKAWRRNFDLAHELFHILTWNVFRNDPAESLPSKKEEKLANTFASFLLMPENVLKKKIEYYKNEEGKVALYHIEDIARELGVSLDALIYRLSNMYKIKKPNTEELLEKAKKIVSLHKPRSSEIPETLPERYCELAQRALREGRLSLMSFAKYMGLTYKDAQEYLTGREDFTDEEISISVT